MNNSKNYGWLIFLFFIIFTGAGGWTALLPLIVVAAVIFAIIKAANAKQNTDQTSYDRGFQRASGYRRTMDSGTGVSAADTAKINVYLRRHFRSTRTYSIGTSLDLRLRGSSYASLHSLDVYRDSTFICSLDDFQTRYPDSYKEIMKKLVSASADGSDDVIDADVVETPVNKEEDAATAETVDKGAQYFIDTINSLNNNIPDEEITNGLYETTSLLKQVQSLEVKFPKSRAKLAKLYDYYLPILVRVLKQFENLQDAKYDENYAPVKEKLTKTIHLINDAMRTIITSMTDADMMNLSADLSTLEALLQKDGLTGDQMKAQSAEGGHTDEQ